MKTPWRGIAKIAQGNHSSFSHKDYGTWDNTYALDIALPVGSDILAPVDGVIAWVDSGCGG